MTEDNTPSRLKKFCKNRIVTHAAAFGAGAATFAVGLRLYNQIAFNERIWAIPASELRNQLTNGSPNLITNKAGVEYYITKMSTSKK